MDQEDKAFVNPVVGSLSSKICKDIGHKKNRGKDRKWVFVRQWVVGTRQVVVVTPWQQRGPINGAGLFVSPHDGRREWGKFFYFKCTCCTSCKQPFQISWRPRIFSLKYSTHFTHSHLLFALHTSFSNYLSTTTPFSPLLPCLYYILLASTSDWTKHLPTAFLIISFVTVNSFAWTH